MITKKFNLVLVGTFALVSAMPIFGACPAGMVESGSTCIDKYEASMWKVTNQSCIAQIKAGIPVNLAACGATQISATADYPSGCSYINGAGCKDNIFAMSVPNVRPATVGNYFSFAAACRNSGKRLPTNAEWQAAALGTPDPKDLPPILAPLFCNVNGPSVGHTGIRSRCVSDVGAHDMVGNVVEFVADWGILATAGTTWDAVLFPGWFGGDSSMVGGPPALPPALGLPSATLRGGSIPPPTSAGTGETAGVYAIDQNGAPSSTGDGLRSGFRCAK